MDFTSAIFKLAILIYGITRKIKHLSFNSDLRDVSEQNDTSHGDFCAEMNLFLKTIRKKLEIKMLKNCILQHIYNI